MLNINLGIVVQKTPSGTHFNALLITIISVKQLCKVMLPVATEIAQVIRHITCIYKI